MNENNSAVEAIETVNGADSGQQQPAPLDALQPRKLYGNNQRIFDTHILDAVKTNGPINSIRLQRVLDTRYEVSPAVLRGALKRLEGEGLVKHSGQKRGTLYEAV